jgi:GNAT superfamily N-acetyltransferase
MKPQRHFDTGWRERLTLADGTRVELRLVQPDDAELLREGFERLSMRSRFKRFHAPKSRLSEYEVRYLTAVDGEEHLALGAVGQDAEGREAGLGIARFIRLAQAPEVAEAAITVVDTAQGKGLGRILLDRLTEAARERGVERFECRILPGNVAMFRLLNERTPDGTSEEEDALCVSVSLAAIPRRKWNLLWLLLALAAQGVLTVVLGPAEPPPSDDT